MPKKKRPKTPKRQPQRRKKKSSRTAFNAVLGVVIAAAVIYGGVTLLQQHDASLAGDRVEQLAAQHTNSGCVPAYNSTPPTSGCHAPDWEHGWGIHDREIDDVFQVHNLEHGGIMVQYRPNPVPGVSTDYIEDLHAFIQELRRDARYCKVILAPYARLQETIALTAWGWILTLDSFDAETIKRFIDDHIGREGPEAPAPCN